MKMKKFTLAILPLILITACSKDEAISENSTAAFAAAGTYISGWESGYSWNRSDSADYQVYSYERRTPVLNAEILQTGAVVVALKNVPYKIDSLWTAPRIVPFSVIPYYGHDHQGRPAYDQHWYIIPKPGSITLKYRSNRHHFSGEPVIPPDERVAARYFLLTAQDLERIGQTKTSVYRLSYSELVELLGTTP